jgi:excisionase family DNA binding protein
MIQLLPLSEAALSLGVSPDTLRSQVRFRRLTARKVGNRWYVTPEEVERYRAVVQGKGQP